MPQPSESPSIIIFIHIPKTGGQSFNAVLERQYSDARVRGLYTTETIVGFKHLPEAERNDLDLLEGHIGFGMHQYINRPARYITFMRNPVDLVLSTYYYILRQPTHQFHQTIVENSLSLKDFVERGIDWLGTDNGQTRILAGENGEYCWPPFGECTVEMLDRAKANLRDHFSVVGLTESFDASLILFKRAFGWRMPYYEFRNKTEGRPSLAQAGPDVRALIESQNAFDIELYRYAQQLFEAQIKKQGASFKVELQAFQWLNNLRRQLRQFRKQVMPSLVNLKFPLISA
jgi:hypothetical protein